MRCPIDLSSHLSNCSWVAGPRKDNLYRDDILKIQSFSLAVFISVHSHYSLVVVVHMGHSVETDYSMIAWLLLLSNLNIKILITYLHA